MLDANTPATDYAVLRFAKIRTLAGLGAVSAHNTRTASQGLAHTTPTPDGAGVVLLDGQHDAVAAWKDRAAAVGLGKPRRDAVLAIEMVMSASPTWFANATQGDQDEWTERSVAYAKKIFGDGNILQATIHLDEQTTHLHVIGIPLEQKERAKAGRPRKGRTSAKRPATLSWGLNADGIIGSPDLLRDHQTAYAVDLADLGLRRGRPKRATAANHLNAAQYRDMAAEDRALATIQREMAADQLQEAAITLSHAHTVARKTIDRAQSRERIATKAERDANAKTHAFTLGLDAVDQGELVPRPNGSRLEIKEVDKPVLPPLGSDAFGKWAVQIKPFFSALVGYAKRLAGLATREREVERREAQLAKDAEALKRVAERAAWQETITTKGQGDRPARDDYNTIAEIIQRQPPTPTEFADPPGSRSPRERGKGRERVR
jgi:hypothetical protein